MDFWKKIMSQPTFEKALQCNLSSISKETLPKAKRTQALTALTDLHILHILNILHVPHILHVLHILHILHQG